MKSESSHPDAIGSSSVGLSSPGSGSLMSGEAATAGAATATGAAGGAAVTVAGSSSVLVLSAGRGSPGMVGSPAGAGGLTGGLGAWLATSAESPDQGCRFRVASKTSEQYPQRTHPSEILSWSGTTRKVVPHAGHRVV